VQTGVHLRGVAQRLSLFRRVSHGGAESLAEREGVQIDRRLGPQRPPLGHQDGDPEGEHADRDELGNRDVVPGSSGTAEARLLSPR